VNIDYREEMALVGLIGEVDSEEMIAIGRFKFDPADNMAEVAFLVRDDWQGRGIGTHLLKKLIDIARERGIKGFKADVLAENRKMLSVFHNCGYLVKTKLEDGSYSVTVDFTHREGV
jgi:GNAT superfamily N-acetyltransferase